jgi:hypothetical protein
MKKLFAALFLLCLASTTPAKADAIVSGSVYNKDLSGNVCTGGGSSSSSLSLTCGSTSDYNNGYASLVANVSDTSGSVHEELQSGSANHDLDLTVDSEDYSLSVTGMYILTGGTGYGTVNLYTSLSKGSLGNLPRCTLTFDGQTQSCDAGGVLTAYVPYNTPLYLDLSVLNGGDAEFDDGYHVFFGYDFSALTPVDPVPEPASLLLLGTGLIPLVQRLRRRA